MLANGPTTRMPLSILYIAETNLTKTTGMGRVGCHWKETFEASGHVFKAIGPREVGPLKHPGFFPSAALRCYRAMNWRPDVLMVHEPAAGAFCSEEIPIALVSHGLERRAWEELVTSGDSDRERVHLRSRLLFPLWRLRGCDVGLRKAPLLLLVSQQDKAYAQNYYCRSPDEIDVFQNGVSKTAGHEYPIRKNGRITILFSGSWIKRKGTSTLIRAAVELESRGLEFNWLLAGTGLGNENSIIGEWPKQLQHSVQIISSFDPTEETRILAQADIFVLPSFFEGQPLSLLQAMEFGLCCITSACCGQQDFIQPNKNGLLHRPGDNAALADLIERCATQPNFREELGRNARISMQSRTWDAVSKNVMRSVEAMAANTRRHVRHHV